MEDASPVPRMTLEHVVTSGRRPAPDAVYPHPGARPPVRRRPARRAVAPERLQADVPGPHPPGGRLRRLRPVDLRVRGGRGAAQAPSPETVRKALIANLPDPGRLERRLNDALRAGTPARLGGRHRVAIDLTLLPYHGRPEHDEDELYRGQVKSGTTHFHAYATAYLVRRG